MCMHAAAQQALSANRRLLATAFHRKTPAASTVDQRRPCPLFHAVPSRAACVAGLCHDTCNSLILCSAPAAAPCTAPAPPQTNDHGRRQRRRQRRRPSSLSQARPRRGQGQQGAAPTGPGCCRHCRLAGAAPAAKPQPAMVGAARRARRPRNSAAPPGRVRGATCDRRRSCSGGASGHG